MLPVLIFVAATDTPAAAATPNPCALDENFHLDWHGALAAVRGKTPAAASGSRARAQVSSMQIDLTFKGDARSRGSTISSRGSTARRMSEDI